MLPVGIELFSYVTKNLLLQDICIAADHVSDNDPNVKDMNNWGANLFSKCHLNALGRARLRRIPRMIFRHVGLS